MGVKPEPVRVVRQAKIEISGEIQHQSNQKCRRNQTDPLGSGGAGRQGRRVRVGI